MSALARLQQTWTFADLAALPDDVDWRRYEIIDGALVVSPSTGMRHEFVSQELRTILRTAGLPTFRVAGPIAVDLAPSYLIPDLVVVTDAVARSNVNPVPAGAAQLVVEIESPSTRTADRVVKPALYAEAGIQAYLRIETAPDIRLFAYTLAAGSTTYAHVGSWGPGETARLSTPLAVEIPIDAITP